MNLSPLAKIFIELYDMGLHGMSSLPVVIEKEVMEYLDNRKEEEDNET